MNKKKISSRGRKNDAISWDEIIPITKKAQMRLALIELHNWVKFLDDIAPVDYCRACGADKPKKK